MAHPFGLPGLGSSDFVSSILLMRNALHELTAPENQNARGEQNWVLQHFSIPKP